MTGVPAVGEKGQQAQTGPLKMGGTDFNGGKKRKQIHGKARQIKNETYSGKCNFSHYGSVHEIHGLGYRMVIWYPQCLPQNEGRKMGARTPA